MNNYVYSLLTDLDYTLPVYLIKACRNWKQEPITLSSGYHYQWIQCVRGEGRLEAGGKTYLITPGNGMLLMKDQAHSYYPISDTWVVDWVVFDGSAVLPLLSDFGHINHSCALSCIRPDLLSEHIHAILDNETHQDSSLPNTPIHTEKSLRSSQRIYRLLTDLFVYAGLPSKENPIESLSKNNLLTPVFWYIQQNYHRPIAIDELAALVQLTPQHLCTVFKKKTNMTLVQYMNRVRLTRSKELLMTKPTAGIKEIAFASGFQDTNYFGSVFKREEGMSPGEFRKMGLG